MGNYLIEMADPVSPKVLGQRLGKKKSWCYQIFADMKKAGYRVIIYKGSRVVDLQDVLRFMDAGGKKLPETAGEGDGKIQRFAWESKNRNHRRAGISDRGGSFPKGV